MTIINPDYGNAVPSLTNIALAKDIPLVSEAEGGPINYLYCIAGNYPATIVRVDYNTFQIVDITALEVGDIILWGTWRAPQIQLYQHVLYIPCGTYDNAHVTFFDLTTMIRFGQLDLQSPLASTGFSFMDIDADLNIADLYVGSGNGIERMDMNIFMWTGELHWDTFPWLQIPVSVCKDPNEKKCKVFTYRDLYFNTLKRKCLIGTYGNYLLKIGLPDSPVPPGSLWPPDLTFISYYYDCGGFGFITDSNVGKGYFTVAEDARLKSVSIAGYPTILTDKNIAYPQWTLEYSCSDKYGRYGYFPTSMGFGSHLYIYKVDLITGNIVQKKEYLTDYSYDKVWFYITQINGLLYASCSYGLLEISPDDLSVLRWNSDPIFYKGGGHEIGTVIGAA